MPICGRPISIAKSGVGAHTEDHRKINAIVSIDQELHLSTTTVLIDRLLTHRMLGSAPPDQIAWIAAHGALRQLETGAILTSKDGPVEGLHIVLNGHLTIYVDPGAGRLKVME